MPLVQARLDGPQTSQRTHRIIRLDESENVSVRTMIFVSSLSKMKLQVSDWWIWMKLGLIQVAAGCNIANVMFTNRKS
jgi:hypothetical protein